MWQTIVVEILKVLGPLILARLEEWLKRRLTAHATAFAAAGKTTAGPEPDAAALLRAVRGELWAWQWRRRAFLDAAVEKVPAAVAGRVALTDDAKRGLSALAVAAD